MQKIETRINKKMTTRYPTIHLQPDSSLPWMTSEGEWLLAEHLVDLEQSLQSSTKQRQFI